MTAPPEERRTTVGAEEPAAIRRYTFAERLLHWFVALTFIYLMLSGFALGYPRMSWLYDVLGGGQTVRVVHPIIGVAFTVGVVGMLVVWARDMRPTDVDREWGRRLRTYIREGHTGLDIGRFNAGQKGYFWYALVTGVLLLATGIPLWFPEIAGLGFLRVMRIVHHVLFLLTVAGFIIHVYMSTVMFPGTFTSMTSGEVTRAWAAHHHPRWFRERDRARREPTEPAPPPERP